MGPGFNHPVLFISNRLNYMKGTGKRFNTGKPKMGLSTPFAMLEMAKVLTNGAHKYGDHNWQKGMKWSTVTDSLERHLAAFKAGKDFDEESGALHMAHVMCNAMFLTEYYGIFPQGDDRLKSWHWSPRIGLDIDDTLAKFAPAYCKEFGLNEPRSWMFDPLISQRLGSLSEMFWLGLEPLVSPDEMTIDPVVYVTARDSSLQWATQEWLDRNGFPTAPLVCGVANKVDTLREYEVEVYLDDAPHHFRQISEAGILCFLNSAKHNQSLDVGHLRVDGVKDFYDRLFNPIAAFS